MNLQRSTFNAQRSTRHGPLHLVAALCLCAAAVFLFLPGTGCARFTTTQLQLDTLDDTGKVLHRQTRTHASATTFFEAKSALANFKASQTDKSQTATVGSLNQEASASNALNLVESAVGAAVRAAVRTVVPVPAPTNAP